MRPFLLSFFAIWISLAAEAQQQTNVGGDRGSAPGSVVQNTKIISFGTGFPNLYRMRYDEPAGYTRLKTTGFGPVYARFELGAFRNVGLVASFAYATFHYSYYGYSTQVIHYDDVNTLQISLAGSYHFSNWIKNPRLDLYATGGLAVDYQKLTYGNIPPYRDPETKAHINPVLRAGARYYLDHTFGLFGEAGYDGLSVVQVGFSVRF